MKTLIDNRTNLSYEEIGSILDGIQEKEKGTTQYYGKWKGYEIETKTKRIKIETMIMQRYFKVLIMEEQ